MTPDLNEPMGIFDVLRAMAALVETAQSESERRQLVFAVGLEACRYFKDIAQKQLVIEAKP